MSIFSIPFSVITFPVKTFSRNLCSIRYISDVFLGTICLHETLQLELKDTSFTFLQFNFFRKELTISYTTNKTFWTHERVVVHVTTTLI